MTEKQDGRLVEDLFSPGPKLLSQDFLIVKAASPPTTRARMENISRLPQRPSFFLYEYPIQARRLFLRHQIPLQTSEALIVCTTNLPVDHMAETLKVVMMNQDDRTLFLSLTMLVFFTSWKAYQD